MVSKNMRLGDLLMKSQLITEEQLNNMLALQKTKGKKLGEVIIEQNLLSEKQIIEVLEYQLGIPHFDLRRYHVDPQAVKKISENLARKYMVLPIDINRNKLVVAMADPLNYVAVDDIKLITRMDIEVGIAGKNDLSEAISRYYDSRGEAASAFEEIEEFKVLETSEAPTEREIQFQSDIRNAPVVRLVNSLIVQAVKEKASDIHIEPYDKKVRIRFRIDGDLKEVMSAAKSSHPAIVTRIKIIGKLDISEKRVPQDGRVETEIENRRVDMRISILPTVHGEKVVLRLLEQSNLVTSKDRLGFLPHNLTQYERIIKYPEGIILVTGPTGSGKTTTLYTMLKELNQINKNIITVEDPVEYKLEGINQVQVNVKAGLTFASGLRSILRQDPDIVMVGEIRDQETAEIAIRAAITGHLVLSTLHTNDTASSVARLVDMGTDAFMVASAVVGVVAQRLVKKICPNCKTTYEASDLDKKMLGKEEEEDVMLHRGTGCSVCYQTGYSGRTAIHEIMVITRDIRNLINQQVTADVIKDKAVEQGMMTLYDCCNILVMDGVTTLDELLRVTYSFDID